MLHPFNRTLVDFKQISQTHSQSHFDSANLGFSVFESAIRWHLQCADTLALQLFSSKRRHIAEKDVLIGDMLGNHTFEVLLKPLI